MKLPVMLACLVSILGLVGFAGTTLSDQPDMKAPDQESCVTCHRKATPDWAAMTKSLGEIKEPDRTLRATHEPMKGGG